MTAASPANMYRLLILSAIWSGSILPSRIGTPALGPAPLTEAADA